MELTRIKKIILCIVPLVILDTTLLFAAQSDDTDAMLADMAADLQSERVRQASDRVQTQAQTQTESQNVPGGNLSPEYRAALLKANEEEAAKQARMHDPEAAYEALQAVNERMAAADSRAASRTLLEKAKEREYLYGEKTPDIQYNESVADYMNRKANAFQVEAFTGMTDQAFPMTAEQIKAMRRMTVAAQRAAASPAETPAKPVTSSQIVSLAPGSTPPVVRLSQGFISTLVFVDATGTDWPIASIDNGNPEAFNVSWDMKGNTIMIQAKKAYTFGNVAVVLKGMSTPVMMTLVPGQREIDYRVDLRVSGLSPDSKSGLMGATLPNTADNELLRVLDNIPPVDSKRLDIQGGGATAWLSDEKIYLRTRYVLLSPGYISVMKSPDGTYAYELQKTPSILVSKHGKPIELRVQGV